MESSGNRSEGKAAQSLEEHEDALEVAQSLEEHEDAGEVETSDMTLLKPENTRDKSWLPAFWFDYSKQLMNGFAYPLMYFRLVIEALKLYKDLVMQGLFR